MSLLAGTSPDISSVAHDGIVQEQKLNSNRHLG